VTVPVLVAVGGPWEAPLVAGLGRAPGDLSVVRRCADLADLVAAADAGLARAAVVASDLHRLDLDAVARLLGAGVAARLDRFGVGRVLPADAPVADVAAALVAALASLPGDAAAVVARAGVRRGRAAGPGAGPDALPGAGADVAALPPPSGPAVAGPAPASRHLSDPADALAPLPRLPVVVAGAGDLPSRPDGGSGAVVAVWGPTGAPGRTTLAVGLAAETAALGRPTILADADTYGPSVAQVLALLDESAGLAAAVRAAAQGVLDPPRLARLAPVVCPHLRVLTGLARTARWPELRPSGLDAVWRTCRDVADWTFVDCGFALETDEELTFDTAAPRRNGATLSALAAADVVVAVGSADPVGLHRLVRGLQDLADVRGPGAAPPLVVVNRVRAAAVGPRPEQRVRDAVARYAGVHGVHLVPDDRPALDEALLAGRTLVEAAPASPARQALAALAAALGAVAPSMSA
jgi:MinD-like ATPase involved in chromosome partitioning or flagellar assembly